MKLKLILTTAIVGATLALPGISSAAPPAPTFQDSVSLTQAPAVFGDGFYNVDVLTATSGPNGENPTGEITLNELQQIFDRGPITCLAVSGNTATFNFVSNFLNGLILTGRMVDDSPDTFTLQLLGRAATDCSPPPEMNVFSLTSGDITVVDAQVPTTRDQCLRDGWKQFGFANQGQCLAFVHYGGDQSQQYAPRRLTATLTSETARPYPFDASGRSSWCGQRTPAKGEGGYGFTEQEAVGGRHALLP
jgi:hypothetical protein